MIADSVTDSTFFARVTELVYVRDLKSLARKGVWVRFPPRAQYIKPLLERFYVLCPGARPVDERVGIEARSAAARGRAV